jgi:hypothetical protein
VAGGRGGHGQWFKIAMAGLVPLLVVFAGIALYVHMLHVKGIEKGKRLSKAFDKRMFIMSADWKAISVASTSAAMR